MQKRTDRQGRVVRHVGGSTEMKTTGKRREAEKTRDLVFIRFSLKRNFFILMSWQ